jgi:ADP-ribosylglycohydrolase
MMSREKAAVMASLLADSLALGVHWIYDTNRLREVYGRVDRLLRPASDSYHSNKDLGELTHYGDQALVLLKSLADTKKFDHLHYAKQWRALFESYRGYFDHATKETLANVRAGKGPLDAGFSSDDLAGASRIAPLVYSYREDLEGLVAAAIEQTKMTHNSPRVLESAEYFARVAWLIHSGKVPVTAMEEVGQHYFVDSPLYSWIKDGIHSKERETILAISDFGQSCHVDEAFPGVVHLIAKYQNDLREALTQCVMAGGDSAARGMLVGMVIGAFLGEEGLPSDWLSQFKYREKVLKYLSRVG